MRALVKAKAEPGLWLEDVAKPRINHDEVLIKVKKSAICGTDLHIYNWDAWAADTVPVPLVIGHEFMGEIVQVGSNVTDVTVGQRVSGEGHLICNTCRNCRAGSRHLCRNTLGLGVHRPGCFAEYVSLPASNVCVLPANIPDEIGAILDPLGNATHTALSFDLVGEDVLITGAGPIGLMATAIARFAGARHIVVTDVNNERLKLAKQLGASLALNINDQPLATACTALNLAEGFDVALEMSGKQSAINDILNNMVHGGKIALLGIPASTITIDWNTIIFRGLILKGIYGREMYETWYKTISMLQSGLDVTKIITHKFKADEFTSAFACMQQGTAAKVILEWD